MAGGGGTGGTGQEDIAAVGLGMVTKGLTETLSELRELGMVGEAGAGRGFDELALSGWELGYSDLAQAFGSFCERWEWGVRGLVNEGNTFAQNVGLAAGTLYETDQYVDGSLKVIANAASGNPYASEDEVTGMSWKELAANQALANPDYSRESFENAAQNAKQGWQDAGRDVLTSKVALPVAAYRELSGLSDEEYEQMLDDRFGPSPEERAKAAEQLAAEQEAAKGQGGSQTGDQN